ncbi:MAG: hypothetical protein MPJ78_15555 [Hyphomicrobiaceae bacterium]|nr:hypothetical protein [Hyphomicrobiaceae bacterium]
MIATASLMFGSTTLQAASEVEHARLNLTSTGELVVTAEDGENYSELKSKNLKFDGYIDVKMKSGKLNSYSVFMGVCGSGQCGTTAFKTLVWRDFDNVRKIEEGISVKVPAKKIPQGLSPNVQAANIFGICNERARGKSYDTEFTHYIKVTLGLNFKNKGFDSSGATAIDYSSARGVPVKVVCRSTNPAPEPYSIDVRLTAQGATCPKKTEARAFIKYKMPATARFRFVHNGKKSVWHTIKARKVSDAPKPTSSPAAGKYLVERVKFYHLDPGEHRFRIEMKDGKKSAVRTINIDCPPFKVTSSWLKYDVEDKPTCKKMVVEETTWKSTRPGSAPFEIKTQGGLVVHSGTLQFAREGLEYVAKTRRTLQMGAFDSDMMARITNQPSANSGWTRLRVQCLEFKGDFSFVDRGAPKCDRKGKALINFSMNVETDIGYSLDCNIGHFSGVAKPAPDGKGGYVAPALVTFDIEKTTRVACALKSVSPGPTKIQALKGELFQCVTPTFDPVTTDLTAEPNPTHDKPEPTIVVDPPRTPPSTGPKVIVDPVRIVCLRGAVRNFKCYCPPKHRKKQFGANKWRCDRIVVDPPRIPPSTGPKVIVDPPRRISCANGAVRNSKCYCPRNRQKVRVGPRAWNCVPKMTVVPPKKPGSSVNTGPRTFQVAPPVRTAPKPKRKKKKKSSRRRSSNNGGPAQMRMIRRR